MAETGSAKYWCGLDWSERRREGRTLRLCAVAGVTDFDALTTVFRRMRLRLGQPDDYEFHAHACPEEWQYLLLADVAAAEIGLRVSVVMREDAVETARQSGAGGMTALGLSAITGLVTRARTVEIACDEDLEGKKHQKPFITGGKRLYRSRWPGEKCKIHFCPSKTSELIQLADVVVFGFGRVRMDLMGHVKLRGLLRSLHDDPQNTVVNETDEDHAD